MNICFISAEYPPETGGGGIGTYTYVLSHGLVELGHNVHVICKSLDNSREYQDNGVWIHRIVPEELQLPKICRKYLTVILSFSEFSQSAFHKFRELIKEIEIDIVETSEYGADGYYLIKNLQVPTVIKLHTPCFLLRKASKEFLSFNGYLIERLEKFTILNATATISPSRSLAEIVARRFKIPISQIKIIPNPVDIDTFIPNNAAVEKELILYVGRLQHLKGVYTLIKATTLILDKIPSLRLILVGHNHNDPHQCKIKEDLIKILKGKNVLHKVEFLDRINRNELIKYYQKSTICVVPSLWENFPYTCLEPMSCGKPVVASRTGGIPEIIEDGISGLLFTPEDEKDLAAKIISLIQNPDKMKEVGKNARDRVVSTFSKQVIAQRTLNFYEQVLSLSS